MKTQTKVLIIYAFLTTILLVTSFVYVVAQSQTVTITSGVYPGAPYYTIEIEGSTIYAKDETGQIDYSGNDASQIINNALQAVPYGGRVLVKAGTYVVSSSEIVVPAYINFEGEGGFASSGDWANPIGTIFVMADNANLTCVIRNENVSLPSRSLTMKNFGIHGNKANNGVGIGLMLTAIERCSFWNIEIDDCAEHGLVIQGIPGTYGAYENDFYHMEILRCDGDGIVLRTTNGSYSQTANENRFFGATIGWCRNGLNISRGGGNSFFGCEFSQCQNGTWFDSGNANYLLGVRIENSVSTAVVFATSNATRNHVSLNTGASVIDNADLNIVWRGDTIFSGYLELDQIAHPTTTGWGNDERGREWYCTTHDDLEYWNGTAIVQVN